MVSPVVVFQRDSNLQISSVHTADKQASTCTGSYSCEDPCCRNCDHSFRWNQTPEAKWYHNNPRVVQDIYFSAGLVYCIFCHYCLSIYIGETGRTLEECSRGMFSIKTATGFPITDHFSPDRYTAADTLVRGTKLCLTGEHGSDPTWQNF